MRTRSQILPVDIDFDGASKAWLQNKKKCGNGTYTYVEPLKEPPKTTYNLRPRV